MVQISEVRVGHDAANGLNSTPRRLRFENFQSIQDAGDKTIQSSKHQAIDALEDRSFGRFALQDVELTASSRALDRNSLVSAYASNMRKSIIGHEYHPIRCLLARRMGFPVGTPRSRRGLACPPRRKQLDGIGPRNDPRMRP